MRAGPLLGLSACLALAACAPYGAGYYDGYAAPEPAYGYDPPVYAQPYGYVAPPGPFYGQDRGYRDRGYRDRDYQDREYRERGDRDRQSRRDQERFDQQRRRQDDQVRQQRGPQPQPQPPPRQLGPLERGILPAVPGAMPR